MKRKASPSVTKEMAAKIKFLHKTPGLYQHQIAAELGVNQGRVSEVLTGKRWPEVDPSDQPSFGF